MAGTRLAKTTWRTRALLLRRTPLREVDLIVELFTEQSGSVSAVARGARRSARRFTGLEPMHLLRVSLDVSPSRELATLTDATLEKPRLVLTGSLARMEAAGRALRWLRRAAPPRSPEPSMWSEINALLETLDDPSVDEARIAAITASSGLRFLAIAGWALELDHCVRCGKLCPPRASAVIDVRAGGVVCLSCGGHGPRIRAALRLAMIAAMQDDTALTHKRDADTVLDLVEAALNAHARGDAT
ncbi:MAG TPA: DNA repair protein RecO [Polyangiaceae bacterium]|nr:DNA repair protein RecO [Polyangiaceae bacterium]